MIPDLIRRGLELHRAGRLSESKSLYEQVLAIQPRHADALHLSGVVALQRGEIEHAIGFIQQAIEVQPDNPGFHGNLAQAFLASRRLAEAHAAFRRAAALDPRAPQFAVGAASCLAMQGNLAQAERDRALRETTAAPEEARVLQPANRRAGIGHPAQADPRPPDPRTRGRTSPAMSSSCSRLQSSGFSTILSTPPSRAAMRALIRSATSAASPSR